MKTLESESKKPSTVPSDPKEIKAMKKEDEDMVKIDGKAKDYVS